MSKSRRIAIVFGLASLLSAATSRASIVLWADGFHSIAYDGVDDSFGSLDLVPSPFLSEMTVGIGDFAAAGMYSATFDAQSGSFGFNADHTGRDNGFETQVNSCGELEFTLDGPVEFHAQGSYTYDLPGGPTQATILASAVQYVPSDPGQVEVWSWLDHASPMSPQYFPISGTLGIDTDFELSVAGDYAITFCTLLTSDGSLIPANTLMHASGGLQLSYNSVPEPGGLAFVPAFLFAIGRRWRTPVRKPQ